MNLIKYFLRKYIVFIYPLIAVCIALVQSFMIRSDFALFVKLLVPGVCMLFAMRASDDIFDFEKDKATKVQYLSKKQLVFLRTFFWCGFVISNVLFYGIAGWYSLLFVGCTLLWEKISALKVLFATLWFSYCFVLNADFNTFRFGAGVAVCLAFSILYGFCKKRIKK